MFAPGKFASRTNWPLEPNRLAQAIEEARRHGTHLIDLTASNPTTCGFQYPEAEILAALADRRALEYAPESKGRLSARQAVAEYYRGRPAFWPCAGEAIVDPERIILTAGTSEAYTYIFRLLCEPGDEVLVPAPSYPLFDFLADLADVRLAPYPLVYDHGWQIDFGALRSALGPGSRAVLVVHPNNPTGSFVSQREAAELAEICAGRGMAIVADEVFLDYAATPPVATPFATNDRRETFAPGSPTLTFTLSGISKISALPQMKLAWTVVGGPAAAAAAATERLEIIADTYLSPGTPVQLALPAFLELGRGMRAQISERIAANLACLDAALRAAGDAGVRGSAVPGAVSRLEREGGWYAVLRVSSTHGAARFVGGADEALAVELVERCAVLAHPGSFYNFADEAFLVVSLITKPEEFAEGIRRLVQFVAGQIEGT